MDFIADGGARGQISSKYLQGTVARRETSDSANALPKLGSPFASSLGTPRFRVIPALVSGSWLLRPATWHLSPRTPGQPNKNVKTVQK
jgi:hypothetical protein